MQGRNGAPDMDKNDLRAERNTEGRKKAVAEWLVISRTHCHFSSCCGVTEEDPRASANSVLTSKCSEEYWKSPK